MRVWFLVIDPSSYSAETVHQSTDGCNHVPHCSPEWMESRKETAQHHKEFVQRDHPHNVSVPLYDPDSCPSHPVPPIMY